MTGAAGGRIIRCELAIPSPPGSSTMFFPACHRLPGLGLARGGHKGDGCRLSCFQPVVTGRTNGYRRAVFQRCGGAVLGRKDPVCPHPVNTSGQVGVMMEIMPGFDNLAVDQIQRARLARGCLDQDTRIAAHRSRPLPRSMAAMS